MTIASTNRKAGPFTGNGTVSVFPFTFQVQTAADILVVETLISSGALTVLNLGTDYTVSLNGDQVNSPGGTITLLAGALSALYTLTLTTNIPLKQPLSIPNQSGFYPAAIEAELDRITIILQQLNQLISQAVTVPLSSTASTALPIPTASSVIGWDPTGLVLTDYPISSLVTVAAYGQMYSDVFTASGATTFVLSQTPASAVAMDVTVDGSTLVPNTDYTLSGNVLTIPSVVTGQKVLAQYGSAVSQGTIAAAGSSQQMLYNNAGVVNGFTMSGEVTVVPSTGVATINAPATHVNYTQGGTGSVSRTVTTKLQESVSVKDFGAVGDGVTDDTAAFNAALTAGSGKSVTVPTPASAYLITSTLSIPTNTTLQGTNKRTCKILLGASTDLMTLGDGAALYGLYLEGNGGTYTGRGLVVNTGLGNQTVQNCRVINFNSTPLAFTATDAGSRFSMHDVEIWQTGGTTGTGKYAVTIPDALAAGANPRKFSHIETSGNCSFSFGGCNDLFITGSFLGDVAYTSNSRSVHIVATRIANQTSLTVDGANHTLQGDCYPAITLASTLTNSIIGPFSNNNPPITDNTGANNSVQIFQYRQTYTPTITAAGGGFTLGATAASGYYTLDGGIVNVVINWTPGAGVNFGSGALRFGLPAGVAKPDGEVISAGVGYIAHSGTPYVTIAQIQGSLNYAVLLRDGTGVVTAASPVAFAAGDAFNIAFSYHR